MITLREEALSIYKPPFSYDYGYITDSLVKVVSDDDGVVARIRGWGNLTSKKLEHSADAIQDELGEILAEALTTLWSK